MRLALLGLVLALLGFLGCAHVSPVPEPPPGCVDTFSGRVTRGCL
jgi:hypothetical protein